jgi:hypothetical protein
MLNPAGSVLVCTRMKNSLNMAKVILNYFILGDTCYFSVVPKILPSRMIRSILMISVSHSLKTNICENRYDINSDPKEAIFRLTRSVQSNIRFTT